MRFIFSFLAAAAGIYSLLIFIRIIFSWLGGFASGRTVELLTRITDPYLDWWRRTLNLRVGFLDFSAIAAIVFLSLVQNIFYALSSPDNIHLGRILAVVLLSAWSVISIITVFFIIIIVLRGIAYLTNRDIYSPFWRMVDSVSQPVLYRLNRIIFGSRIGGFLKGMILSLLMLAAIMVGGGFIVMFLADFLSKLPV